MNIAIKFYIYKMSKILNFWIKFTPKNCISGQKYKKWPSPLNSEYSRQPRHEISSLADSFQSKTEKMNTTSEFCIFELV